MNFQSPDLGRLLADTPPEVLDDLPFGVVRMDIQSIVEFYNRYESELSGISTDNVLGKHFFSEVAPCTNNFLVAIRYETESLLDETLDYVFTYRMAPTKVRLRLLKDAGAGWQFLCVEKIS